MMPETLRQNLQQQVDYVASRHKASPQCVHLPNAYGRKNPSAEKSLAWQYLFPAARPSPDPNDKGRIKLHHIHENSLQKAVAKAAQRAGIRKPCSPHSFRHRFATSLIENGADVITVKDLLGHKSVQTTMIYTHLAKPARQRVRSPLDIKTK